VVSLPAAGQLGDPEGVLLERGGQRVIVETRRPRAHCSASILGASEASDTRMSVDAFHRSHSCEPRTQTPAHSPALSGGQTAVAQGEEGAKAVAKELHRASRRHARPELAAGGCGPFKEDLCWHGSEVRAF